MLALIWPLLELDEADGEILSDHVGAQQRVLRSAPCTEHRNRLTITPKWIMPRWNMNRGFGVVRRLVETDLSEGNDSETN